jgi:biopolymer transport protein TolR
VSVKLPPAKNTYKPENGGKPIVVAVAADGGVYVGDAKVELDKLTEKMEHEIRYNPGQRILLKGDRALEYGKVREVLDRVQKAGASGVSLAAEQIKEKKGEGGAEGAPGEGQ